METSQEVLHDGDPENRGTGGCARPGHAWAKAACQLYAVNDKVVWDASEMARRTPISERGQWWGAYGLTPQDTTMPTDPNQRALVGCQRASGAPCKLYAVNGSVVWKP
jgi:hypothetical protein